MAGFTTSNMPEIERHLRGARIERVLIGRQNGVFHLVVATDRIDPEFGQKLSLVVSDPAEVCVGTFVVLPIAKSPEASA
ncbi:MAG: hypothetical protein ABSH05_23160 [Bryobacteraceae bacterium]|jgi:hypothetical protein